MWATGGLCRQVPADAAASQLGKASGSTLPLFPGDGAQPSPDRLIKFAQHRRGLAEAEVAAPSDQIDGQLLDNLREASTTRAPRELPNLCVPPVKLKPRNLRTLGLATALFALLILSFEAFFKELLDTRQHSFACLLTAHIDVTVIGITHKAVAAFLQFLVQLIQHQIGQQR